MWVQGLAQFWSFKIFHALDCLNICHYYFIIPKNMVVGFFSISFSLYFWINIFYLIIRLESKMTNLWKLMLQSREPIINSYFHDPDLKRQLHNRFRLSKRAEDWGLKKSKTLAKRKRDRVAHIGIDTVSTLVKL